jgi:O-antigen ligase
MAGFRSRIALGDLEPVVLLGVSGAALTGAAFAYSAYAIGPAVLPAALLGLAVAAFALSRPVGGVCLAFLAAPLELYALPLPTGSLSPSEGIFALVGLSYLARATFRPDTVRKPGVRDIPYVVLLGAASVGIGLADAPAPIMRILAFWTLFYLVYLQVQSFTEHQIRQVLWSLAIGGAILGGIGAVQFISSGAGGLYAGGAGASVRAVGTFGEAVGDSNYFASFLQLAALPAIALIVAQPRRNAMLVPLVAITVTGLAFSLSRGGMLGFAAGLLLLLLWGRARWMAAGVTVVVAVITIAGANPLVASSSFGTVEQRLATVGDLGQTSTNTRPELFQQAVDLTIEYPLTGVGLNQYIEHSAARGLTERGRPHETAHNVYLSLSSETGLIGVGAFLAFIGLVVRRAFVALRHRTPISRAAAFGCAAALFGFAIQGLTVSLNRNNLLWATFLVLAGILVALSDRAPVRTTTEPQRTARAEDASRDSGQPF